MVHDAALFLFRGRTWSKVFVTQRRGWFAALGGSVLASDVTSVAAKKQCGLDVVLYLFSFIFQELIILPCYLVFIVLAAALLLFRNLT